MRPLILCLSLLALVSCATTKSLPDADLSALARKVLGGPSRADPLELTLATDYTRDRMTLVRTYVVTTVNGVTSSSPSMDTILGISFGNGLFLDNNGNLSIRVRSFAGVDDAFIGTTVRSGFIYTLLGANPIETTAVYSKDKIDIKTKGQLFGDDTITHSDKTASGAGQTVFFNPKNTKLQPSLFIPLVSTEFVWEKTATGLRKSWGLFDNREYNLVDGKITDKEKSFVVENTGEYLRFAYTKGDLLVYRVYRNSNGVVVLDEKTGSFVFFKIEGKKVTWQERSDNLFGGNDKPLDYSFSVQ